MKTSMLSITLLALLAPSIAKPSPLDFPGWPNPTPSIPLGYCSPPQTQYGIGQFHNLARMTVRCTDYSTSSVESAIDIARLNGEYACSQNISTSYRVIFITNGAFPGTKFTYPNLMSSGYHPASGLNGAYYHADVQVVCEFSWTP